MRDRKNTLDDPHAACRKALLHAYAVAAEKTLVKQVLQQDEFGHYQVLQVEHIDLFEDGLRIIVR